MINIIHSSIKSKQTPSVFLLTLSTRHVDCCNNTACLNYINPLKYFSGKSAEKHQDITFPKMFSNRILNVFVYGLDVKERK